MALSIENCNGGNVEVGSMLRYEEEMGLQLRFACERGRLLDVKKLLSIGAPILRDAVSLTFNT